MDLTLTEEQEMIATTARDLLEARSPISHVREMLDDDKGYSPELWKELAEMGWTGLAIPEDQGGEGAGFVELCLIIEAMGGALLPGPFIPTVAIAASTIAEHGSDTSRKDHLGAIASGERIVSYLRASPGPGWPARGSSVSVDKEDGSHVLTGSAQFVSYADAADVLMVVAQGGDPDDLTVFLIDSESDGLSVEPLDTVGLDHQGTVVFDGVRAGPADILGESGSGREVVDTIEAYGGAATCAEMVGGAQRVLDMTLEYARDREQFDTPIGAFQAVQHHCANMGVDVLSSRLMSYETIWRLDEGLDATGEVSMAKAWVSEAYERVCALAHQIHGAIGYTEEHDLHLYLRHSTSLALAFGDADHHWARVADHLDIPN